MFLHKWSCITVKGLECTGFYLWVSGLYVLEINATCMQDAIQTYWRRQQGQWARHQGPTATNMVESFEDELFSTCLTQGSVIPLSFFFFLLDNTVKSLYCIWLSSFLLNIHINSLVLLSHPQDGWREKLPPNRFKLGVGGAGQAVRHSLTAWKKTIFYFFLFYFFHPTIQKWKIGRAASKS